MRHAPHLSVAAIGHELREPMNGVLGMTRLLADTSLGAEQRHLVDAITGSAEALLTVINDLLDLSKVEAGGLELLNTAFDPRLLLQRMATPLMMKAQAKNLMFDLSIAEDVPPRLVGDPGRLRQILTNLIGNAVKFTDTGGVEVRMTCPAGPDGPRTRIDVVDTGPGLEGCDPSQLFAGFRQAGAKTARLFGGTGLGLMVSKHLVQAMGGSIGVEPALSRGAHFIVDLPLKPAMDISSRLVPVSLAGLELLVVEPRAILRDRLRTCALGWGMGVRGAAGADDALREIQEARTRGVRFDLAIVSAEIEEHRSTRVLRTIQAASDTVVPAVSLAGSGFRGDAARAHALGFDAYLTEPFGNDDLMHLLMRLAQPTPENSFLTRHSLADQPFRPLNVLVADDTKVNAQLVSIILAKAGHRVTSVADGAAAVASVQDGSFDLVLMDVQMPVMDGLIATRLIRGLDDPLRRNIPVVALTAEAMADAEAAVRAAGMNDYLTKPIDRPKLLSTIRFWSERGPDTP